MGWRWGALHAKCGFLDAAGLLCLLPFWSLEEEARNKEGSLTESLCLLSPLATWVNVNEMVQLRQQVPIPRSLLGTGGEGTPISLWA